MRALVPYPRRDTFPGMRPGWLAGAAGAEGRGVDATERIGNAFVFLDCTDKLERLGCATGSDVGITAIRARMGMEGRGLWRGSARLAGRGALVGGAPGCRAGREAAGPSCTRGHAAGCVWRASGEAGDRQGVSGGGRRIT